MHGRDCPCALCDPAARDAERVERTRKLSLMLVAELQAAGFDIIHKSSALAAMGRLAEMPGVHRNDAQRIAAQTWAAICADTGTVMMRFDRALDL